MNQIRQGDVVLLKRADLTALPEGAKILDHTTVARGEATGHHHTLFGDVMLAEVDGGGLFALVGDVEVAELRHQEHDTLTVSPGVWEVVPQQEYSPQAVRRVAD